MVCWWLLLVVFVDFLFLFWVWGVLVGIGLFLFARLFLVLMIFIVYYEMLLFGFAAWCLGCLLWLRLIFVCVC